MIRVGVVLPCSPTGSRAKDAFEPSPLAAFTPCQRSLVATTLQFLLVASIARLSQGPPMSTSNDGKPGLLAVIAKCRITSSMTLGRHVTKND